VWKMGWIISIGEIFVKILHGTNGNLACRQDLGGDIHANNPGEELNLFDGEVGGFYGYPFCWSEYSLPLGVGHGPRTQWSQPEFKSSKTGSLHQRRRLSLSHSPI